jgi:hypothetical protein
MHSKPLLKWTIAVMVLVAIGGCTGKKTIVGRWESSGTISFYFREDGILFFKPESDIKYQGPYRLSESGLMEARLSAIDGRSGNLTLKLQMEFLTANAVRADTISEDGRPSRVLQLIRSSEATPQTVDS